MTIAVCARCGSMKFGAWAPCWTCKERPTSAEDMARSMALTDHIYTPAQLNEISRRIKAGQPPPELPPERMQQLKVVSEAFKHMLPPGDGRPRVRTRAHRWLGFRQKMYHLTTGYFLVGFILAVVMWGSYLYPALRRAPDGVTVSDRILLAVRLQPIAILGGAVRFVLWAPGLAWWMVAPSGYPFGMWLAPGFYAETVPESEVPDSLRE